MARYLTTIAVVALLVVGASSAQADWISTITADSPLHWFQFEETSGTTAVDSGSAGTNGTYENGVMLDQAGLVGRAVGFDAVDDYVLVDGPDLSGDWTAEFITAVGEGGASQGLMGGATMAIKAEQWNDTNSLGYTNFGVVDVNLNVPTPSEMTHLVYVQSATGVDLYVNGALAASDPTTAVLSRQVIGAGRKNADDTLVDLLDGLIDDVVIYDRALSADTIASHYAAIPEPGSLLLGVLGIMASLWALARVR